MKDRVILHCDLNNFFASVSLLSNKTLYNMPVAVCGSVEKRHGIVLAKNEIAKREGVKTAEAIWEAKSKCPDLVILPPDYKEYHRYSVAAHKIYERYTDCIEPFGIDECWLDVTGSEMIFGDGKHIADRIRRELREELGITASVGVSFNKIFAKLGSDMKKPDATTVITRENFKEKVWKLPAGDLLFVGKSTIKRLKESGIFTIGDITQCDVSTLKRILGKNGEQLKKYAMGLDDSPVKTPTEDDMPKSVGRSVTLDHDITSADEVWSIFVTLSEEISNNLKQKGLYASSVQIHTRDTSLKIKETARAMRVPENTAMIIAKSGMKLFKETYKWNMPLRSVGLRAINLKTDGFAVQQDIFGEAAANEKEVKIEKSMSAVRDKFGKSSIKRAITITGGQNN